MILNDTPWLSETPDMLKYPDLALEHVTKYSDTNYDILFSSGRHFKSDIYIVPVSSKFTTPISGISDEFYYDIPEDVIDRIKSGTCKLVWDMTFEIYNPDVMAWLRHHRTEAWAHRSYDFIQNTQGHYELTKSDTYLALNNMDWPACIPDYTQPICINKCDSWYYPDTDTDYSEQQLKKYQCGQDFDRKFITTLGELRQHKIKLANKIWHCDTSWYASARSSVWESATNVKLNLPWVLDEQSDPGLRDHYRPISPELQHFMSNSMIDVVCDTIMLSSPLTARQQTTEKPFRSICMFKPWLYLGCQGGLAYMRDLGFKTFNDYWDETYDDISDPDLRYQAVINIINLIDSDAHFHRKLQGIENILLHNYNHYIKLLHSEYHTRFL